MKRQIINPYVRFVGTQVQNGPAKKSIGRYANRIGLGTYARSFTPPVSGFSCENLVTNGEFETDLSGWINSSTGTGTATWNNSAVDLLRNDVDNQGQLDQEVTTEVGKDYIVGAVGVGATTRLFLGTTQGGFDLLVKSPADGMWEEEFTATTTSTWIRLNNSGNGTTVTFDQIVICEKPPEPAAVVTGAEVGLVDNDIIEITFNKEIFANDYALGWNFEENTVPLSVSNAAKVPPNGIQFMLSAPVSYGTTVTYSYDDTIGDLRNEDDVPTASTSGNVTNNVQDTTPPTVPQNVVATAISTSQIDIEWDASTDTESGMKEYVIYRDTVEIDRVPHIILAYLDSGLNAGTTYTYNISAVDNSDNESAQSADAPATTLEAAPVVTSAEVGNVADNVIAVLFDKEVNATDYALGWSFTEDASPVTVSNAVKTLVNEVQFTLSADISPGTTVAYAYSSSTGNYANNDGVQMQSTSGSVTNNVSDVDPDVITEVVFNAGSGFVLQDISGHERNGFICDDFDSIDSSPPLNSHQGMAYDAIDGKWITIDTGTIYRRNATTWSQEAINSTPFANLVAGTDHLGDGCVYGNEVFIGADQWLGCGSNVSHQIAVYDRVTLAYVRSRDISGDSDFGDVSGVAVDSATGTLYISSYCVTDKVWVYDAATLAYQSTIQLEGNVPQCQGIVYRNGRLYMTADPVSEIGDKGDKRIYIFETSGKFYGCYFLTAGLGAQEGGDFISDSEYWAIYDNGDGGTAYRFNFTLQPPGWGVDYWECDPSRIMFGMFAFNMPDNWTICMDVNLRSAFNYNCPWDVSASNKFETWYSGVNVLGYRLNQPGQIEVTVLPADQRRRLTFTSQRSGGNSNIEVFDNGVSIDTGVTTWQDSGDYFHLGAGNRDNNNGDCRYYRVKIWNRVLSPAEIASLCS